ncbi:PQQ-dependent dehydrogenase, methanol/ethanol family [Rhodoferax sediminis]|jgi:PQQ-dependent dehydrogenase (methanol/ethanol family)|uniref:PQQ-dependent dehydrogenase, methanol/ethanol family n=1 Tax=Rhodoferax sediminis TaxID=2509614 RepID=A0A515D9C0_9BURK|nr:PQQ-dependent dehydrogenase, methanol/ethanol family [Rhodoferax sediminis]QDL37009.1 PQQ-dependent dehydrogenase, methanol/ethanol family [Rhodoferax sediminis]
MKRLFPSVAFAVMLGIASTASAQNWPVYGGDAGNTRFSQSTEINTSNVNKLKVKWALQLGSLRSQESTPILVGDTLYVSSSFGPKNTFALDARTGQIRWQYSPDVPKGIDQYACCDVDNRGVAYNDGKIFVGRLDANVAALDAKTGKELWVTKIVDYTQGSVITSPPTLVKNLVITGYGGGEYGARGALVALDQATGKEVWRTYTTPLPGEKNSDTWKGDSGKLGGGAAWFVGSYDPKLNLVYYGTSNPSPWAAIVRGSDSSDIGPYTNLYTSSVIALNPETGNIVWHYQFTPHDAWDYDGVNELVFADLPVQGKKTPVIMTANRNGFFYVLDRANGKLISAKQFIDGVNWATGIDMKTGMPIEAADNAKRPGAKRKATNICPALLGGKNWMPMSYDHVTGLVYIPTLNMCMDEVGEVANYTRGAFYLGVNFNMHEAGDSGYLGGVKAWDPVAQKTVWFNKDKLPWAGGMLSTAGGLVFHGDIEGWFKALDAKTGKTLWKFNAGSGISAAPMTYTLDGKQYVAVVAGRTESIPAFAAAIGEKMVAASPEGGALYVFTLN